MDQKQKTEEGFSYTYSAKENQAFRREVEERSCLAIRRR